MSEQFTLWDTRVLTALWKRTTIYLLPTPLAGFVASIAYGMNIALPLAGVLLSCMDTILIAYLGWKTVNFLKKSVFLAVETVTLALETLGVWLTMGWIETVIPGFSPDIIRALVSFTPGILAASIAKDSSLDVGTRAPNHVRRIAIIVRYLKTRLGRGKNKITVRPSDLGWKNIGHMKFMFMDYLYAACTLLNYKMESIYNPPVKGKVGLMAFLNRPEGFVVLARKGDGSGKRRKRKK